MPLDKTQKAHRLAGLVYLLYGLGFLFGVTAIIGIIINHTRLPDTQGTYSYSHFLWQIVSFWILFAGVVLALILLPAKAAVAACLIWWVCTALFGIWFLTRNQPVPFFNSQPRKSDE